MELLVQIVDKVNPDDFYLNCQLPKAGDVIGACPDGWQWGTQELANPDWRILSVPDLSAEDASTLVTPERDVDTLNPSRTLQYRAFHLDLQHPDAAALAPVIEDSSVIDVVAAKGVLLSDVAVTETITSKVETIVPVDEAPDPILNGVSVSLPAVDSPVAVVSVDVSRDVTVYPVSALAIDLPTIQFVGPKLRTQAISGTDAVTILAIKTQRKPVADPTVLGGVASVVGLN